MPLHEAMVLTPISANERAFHAPTCCRKRERLLITPEDRTLVTRTPCKKRKTKLTTDEGPNTRAVTVRPNAVIMWREDAEGDGDADGAHLLSTMKRLVREMSEYDKRMDQERHTMESSGTALTAALARDESEDDEVMCLLRGSTWDLSLGSDV